MERFQRNDGYVVGFGRKIGYMESFGREKMAPPKNRAGVFQSGPPL